MNPLKYFARLLLRRFPFGIGACGDRSWIMLPREVYRVKFLHVGKGSLIRAHSVIECLDAWGEQRFHPSLVIGDGVYIGRHAHLVCAHRIEICDGCVLSEQVFIADSGHGYNPNAGAIMKQPLESKGPVLIGPHCFLGYRTVIMPGVELGEHCVVGANSVVTRSFPAFSMIAGSPARLVRRFDPESSSWVKESGGGSL